MPNCELKLYPNCMSETLKNLLTSLRIKKEHFPSEVIDEEEEYSKEKSNRNKSINTRFITSKNLGKLSSDYTPKKIKSQKRKGKSHKFKTQHITSSSYRDTRNIIASKSSEEKRDIKNNNIFSVLEGLRLNQKIAKTFVKKRNNKQSLIHLKLPHKLKKEIESLNFKVVYPIDNIYGLFEKYEKKIKDSLKALSNVNYNLIFSLDNAKNMKYLVHEYSLNENGLKKKLLLLDLDETLIHSEIRDKNNFFILNKLNETANCYHKLFSYSENNMIYYFDIFFRPYLFDFLHEIQSYFDLGIFTASSKGYADTIINYIDPENKIFKFRLYREACIPIQNYVFIKDLRIIRNYEPSNVILIDNSLYSFINQPKNAMIFYSFYWDNKDDQLIKARNFLMKYIYNAKDVREELTKWYDYNKLYKSK